tara:strand:- start:115 stop:606 length:492 start_codon:yes stop_codon:yes gene_type:complete
MKKLLFLLLPLFAFGQVTTFEEINKINGIQEFQRTVIEEGYSLFDASEFVGESDADYWKIYAYNPVGEGEEMRSLYVAGISVEDESFSDEGIKSVMFFAFANDVLIPLTGKYYDEISSYIKSEYEFAEISQDVYAWYNTESPKVQFGIGKQGGFGWVIKRVLE